MTLYKTKKRWLPAAVALAILTAAGVVFAAAATDLFSVSVSTEGKTDEEVEDEIHDQLTNQGVAEPEVEYRRNDNMTKVDIAGEKDGREFHIVQKRKGDDGSGVVVVQPPKLDTEREPGMTDAELEAKIRAQMEQLGLQGTVKVKGDDLELRVERRVEQSSDN